MSILPVFVTILLQEDICESLATDWDSQQFQVKHQRPKASENSLWSQCFAVAYEVKETGDDHDVFLINWMFYLFWHVWRESMVSKSTKFSNSLDLSYSLMDEGFTE